jgi:hypothetical protein
VDDPFYHLEEDMREPRIGGAILDRRKSKYSEESLFIVTVFTANSELTALGLNPVSAVRSRRVTTLAMKRQ